MKLTMDMFLAMLPKPVKEWTPELPLLMAERPISTKTAERYWKDKPFQLFGPQHMGGSLMGLSPWANRVPADDRWLSGSVIGCTQFEHTGSRPLQLKSTRAHSDWRKVSSRTQRRPDCHADELIRQKSLRAFVERLHG